MHLPFPAALLAPPLGLCWRTLQRSSRLEVEDPEDFRGRVRAGEPFIFCCWHGELLPVLWASEKLGLHVVVSLSADGELLARLLASRGYHLLRGSRSHRGRDVARQSLRVLRASGSIGLALDGPRGPRRIIQPGILRLAQSAAIPLVPIHAAGDGWTLQRSWDRFRIPRPGGQWRLRYGPSIPVGPGEPGLQAARRALNLTLGGEAEHGNS